MVAIVFPASPSLNESFVVGDVTWRWDGTSWVSNSTFNGRMPAGETLQRPADPKIGMIRYNTTLNLFEGYDNSGWRPFQENPIRQAVGISPAANEVIITNTAITLVSNEYVTFVELNHASTDWQIASDLTFANPVVENLADAVNLTSYAIPAGITAEGTMFWRVRYRDTVGNESNWSIPQTFVSVMPVVQPTGTSPSGGQSIATNTTITLTASAFSVTAGSTTHASTDWQVSTSNTFGTTIEESLADTVNLTSYSFTTATEATLFWRVRYRDSAGNVSVFSAPQTFQSITPPPTLGDSYCGGFYIGTTTANATNYYLIVAPNATGCASCQWKTTRTTTAGTTSLVDGYGNTYGPMDNATHPAGNWTATRTIGGFSDWYLPAKDELNQLYVNDGGSTNTNLPAGEGFAADYYWSSTEISATVACNQLFTNGSQFSLNKTNSHRVRAVRREPI